MAKIFLEVLFGLLYALAQVILAPINTILFTFLPNTTEAISKITESINLFMGTGLAWGFNLLPPYTRYFVLFYLYFLVVRYTISYSVHFISWVITIIKKLPLA